ncbi:MAG: FtsX-like permease family protein [Terriglobales bacterium]
MAAGRRALRRPSTALAFILAVAIALGGIVGAFDVAYAVAHRPLPFRDPARIAVAGESAGGMLISGYTWKENPRAPEIFSNLAGYHVQSDFITSGRSQPILLAQVTTGFFKLLGVRMALGHSLPAGLIPMEENLPPQPAIISHHLWISRFGSSPGVIGREISDERLYPYHFRIVGVAPRAMDYPSGVDIWTRESPFHYGSLIQSAAAPSWRYVVIGRLKPGISIAAAEAAIASWPRNQELWVWAGTSALQPLSGVLAGSAYRLSPQLWLLSLILLVTAAAAAFSICNREFEVRLAGLKIRQVLGASSGRLLGTLCVELVAALALAVPAAVLIGTGSARIIAHALSAPVGLTPGMAVIDMAIAAGVLGLIAALVTLRYAYGLGILRFQWLWASARVRQAAPRSGLPVRLRLQVVAATVLLVLAVLLVSGAYSLAHLDPGVRADGLSVAAVDLPFSEMRYMANNAPADPKTNVVSAAAGRRAAKEFYRRTALDIARIRRQVASYPGVTSVAVMTSAPFTVKTLLTVGELVSPVSDPPPSSLAMLQEVSAHPVGITEGTLRELGIRMLYGRYLTKGDRFAVVINLAMAKSLGPGASALGKYVAQPGFNDRAWDRVVGIVRNTRQHNLLAPATPTFYFLLSTAAVPSVDLVVRARAGLPTPDLREWIQSAAQHIVPGSTVLRLANMDSLVRASSQPLRRAAFLLLALALPGLAMAAICAWGQADGELRRRRGEAGIRLALGARPARLACVMLYREMAYAIAAAAVGACLAWWISGVIVLQFPGATVHFSAFALSVAVIVVLEFAVALPTLLSSLRRDPGELIAAADG